MGVVVDDLWDAAGEDHGHWQRQAAVARADAEMQENVMPFVLAARSGQELDHRIALAEPSISAIAELCGISSDELVTTARRHFELYRQALMEGTDPLQALEPELGGGDFGSGPEKPDSHTEAADWSGDYAEVPQGAQGGPDPAVVRPRPPMTGPVQEATGMRRRADSSPSAAMTPSYMPGSPDTGTGTGATDIGTPSAATGGMTPSLPAGVAPNGDDTVPITPPGIGQVTSSADPVRRKVMAVTAAIRATNPHLPQGECERVARVVVGRYLREADLAGSVMNDDPVGDGGSSGGSSSGDSGGGGSMLQHGLEWKGLRSMMPGGGGAAGEAGGAASLAEEAPMLAAL